MKLLIRYVLGVCCPAQMPRRDAPIVPVATTMCRFVFGGRRRTMRQEANPPCSKGLPAILPNLRVALLAAIERPVKAIVTSVRQRFREEASGLPIRRRQREEWVTMLLETFVMQQAKPTSFVLPTAVGNGANSMLGHGSPPDSPDSSTVWSGMFPLDQPLMSPPSRSVTRARRATRMHSS